MSDRVKKKARASAATARPRRPIMLREIYESPERLEVLIAREMPRAVKALSFLREQRPSLIFVAGRGTSHHAAIYGHYMFEHFLGIPVSGAALSLHTLYPAPLHLAGALAIGLSQSGESADVVKALRTARRRGAFTVAVTNTPNSALTHLAHHTILLHAREERAVAATKTYTAQLAAVALICRALGGNLPEAEIRALPEAVDVAVRHDAEIADLVPYYRYAPRCLCLARGFNYATTREVALKLMETCYLGSVGMSAADFLHGPVAFVDEDTPILLFAPDGPTYSFMRGLASKLRRQEVDTLTFTNRPEIAAASTLSVRLPLKIREGLTPVPFAVLGQLFACHLAQVRGINPDAPRRLSKVTHTL